MHQKSGSTTLPAAAAALSAMQARPAAGLPNRIASGWMIAPRVADCQVGSTSVISATSKPSSSMQGKSVNMSSIFQTGAI